MLFIFYNKSWFSFKVGFIGYGAWVDFGGFSSGVDSDMWIAEGVCAGIYLDVDGLGTNLGIAIDL
jgi:hypothetical protein